MTNKTSNGTGSQKSQLYFLIAVLMGIFVLVFFIFRPFLYALIFAAVFAIVFQPVHKKIIRLTRGNQEFSALATIFIMFIFIFTPLIFFGIQILQEAQQLYSSFIYSGEQNTVLNIFDELIDDFQFVIGESTTQNIFANVNQYLQQGLEWLLRNFGIVFSNFVSLIINSLIFLVALYYLLKDGKKFKKAVIALSPLADADNEIIFKKLKVAVNSVIKGRLVIAIVQGGLAIGGFIVFGVPNAAFWGSMTTIAALIPGIGIALVIIPATIYLFITSGFFYGLGLLIWGIVVVGLVDNFLGPKLISAGTELHPLVVLLSILGGIIFFGPVGFILGPLTLSLFFTLIGIYSSLINPVKNCSSNEASSI